MKDKILQAVASLGFDQPTPIQTKTIPHLLTSEQDLVAFAQTGTGKTAGFGLPLVQLTDSTEKDPQVLILCPTRELCMQITRDLEDFSKYLSGIKVVAVYGGAGIEGQIKSLNRGAQIVVGTPGRTKDLIKRRKLLLDSVKHLVLDEADEMLSMGFSEDLDFIIGKIPVIRQTLLFSATKSAEMTAMSRKYLDDPIEIKVAALNKGAESVRHIFYMVHARDRYEALKRIADMNPNTYGIVFCRTRRDTKEIANKLMHDGYNADALHGDMTQAQRDEVMGRFRKNQLQLMVATDVAARGLDVNDLTHVINYNLPDEPQVYTHRSGRTGRAGKKGVSVAIVHTREMKKIRAIERISGIQFTKEPVPTGQEICSKQLFSLIDKIEKVSVDENQIGPFLPSIYSKLQWLDREQLIKHFVSAEFNRFLAYYKNARDLNVHKPERKERRDLKGKKEAVERKWATFSRMYINLGSKHNLTPKTLLSLINESLDSSDAKIGKIEILRKFSFFEIDREAADALIGSLSRKRFKGLPVMIQFSEEKKSVSWPDKGKRSSKSKKGHGKKGKFRKARTERGKKSKGT